MRVVKKMTAVVSIGLLLVGLAVLALGAEFLVRGGASLALALRIRPLVIGLTVVAFGTSAPELAVSIRAAFAGQGAMAAGNVIGSNIFNIAAILGLSAMIFPLSVHARLIRLDIPLMIGVTVLAAIMLWNQFMSRVEGLMLIAGLLAYIALTIRYSGREEAIVENEALAELPSPAKSMLLNITLIVGGLVGLVIGADWFVKGAVALARLAGLSEAVIGLTIVAAGTSLPELATSVVAALRRHADIAAGNIIGSNIFNILGILGITAALKPFSAVGILPVDVGVMLFFAVILLPLVRKDFVLNRWEGGLLLFGFVGYIAYRIMAV